MPTDEERLQALRDEETKTKLFGWLNEWWEGIKAAEKPTEDSPQRTKNEKTSFIDSLFG